MAAVGNVKAKAFTLHKTGFATRESVAHIVFRNSSG